MSKRPSFLSLLVVTGPIPIEANHYLNTESLPLRKAKTCAACARKHVDEPLISILRRDKSLSNVNFKPDPAKESVFF
jgi:hypothetical protein